MEIIIYVSMHIMYSHKRYFYKTVNRHIGELTLTLVNVSTCTISEG